MDDMDEMNGNISRMNNNLRRNRNAGKYDPDTMTMMAKLKAQKDQAIRDQDFDKAKEIDDQLHRLENMADQIGNLEKLKKDSI